MKIDKGIAVVQHIRKDGMRNQPCNAAASTARKFPIQVASVGQIAIAGSNTFGINGRQRDQCAAQRQRVDLCERAPRYLHTV
jgi:hypothetical protein